MYLNDYQLKAAQFSMYQNDMYPVASVMVEAAELADLFIKPKLRGDTAEIHREDIISEAGDVLWNLACILSDNGIRLDDVAVYNLKKLGSRAARGVIQGSGGDR